MLEAVIGVILGILCIIGAASIIRWAVIRISAPSSDGGRIYAVMLEGANADIELQLAIETVDWDSVFNYTHIYAVDCGLQEEMLDTCKKLCSGSRFRLVTPKELYEIISNT